MAITGSHEQQGLYPQGQQAQPQGVPPAVAPLKAGRDEVASLGAQVYEPSEPVLEQFQAALASIKKLIEHLKEISPNDQVLMSSFAALIDNVKIPLEAKAVTGFPDLDEAPDK